MEVDAIGPRFTVSTGDRARSVAFGSMKTVRLFGITILLCVYKVMDLLQLQGRFYNIEVQKYVIIILVIYDIITIYTHL